MPRPRQMELSFDVTVVSVLGQRWTERVFPFESVEELKRKLWKRTGIEPIRQALVFADRELCHERAVLSELGVREGSTIRLVVVARAGPSTSYTQSDGVFRVDSAPVSETERSRRGCSAAEDTSAKESSAGETEHDEEANLRRLERLTEICCSTRPPRRLRTVSTNNPTSLRGLGSSHDGEEETDARILNDTGELCEDETANVDEAVEDLGDADAEMVDEEGPETIVEQAEGPLEESTEDPSELSSGFIICDLSQEFRKLRVRRRHHPTLPSNRAKSRPRGAREGASSSDEGGYERVEHRVQLPLPVRRLPPQNRGGRHVGLRSNAQLRCSVCAFKLTSTFNCRCGKSLCSRHRSAQAHTCSRGRRAQQVSD